MFSLHCRHGTCTGVSTLVEGMHEKRDGKKEGMEGKRNGEEGGREREGRKGEKEREAQCIFIGGGKGIRVALKNTDESPVFKIPVRLRGFALREKGAEERKRERGRMGLVGIGVEGVAGKEVEGQEEARRRG